MCQASLLATFFPSIVLTSLLQIPQNNSTPGIELRPLLALWAGLYAVSGAIAIRGTRSMFAFNCSGAGGTPRGVRNEGDVAKVLALYVGEITANFQHLIFATWPLARVPGGTHAAYTGSHFAIAIFGSKHVLPAYGLDDGHVGLQFVEFPVIVFNVLAVRVGWPGVRTSLSFCPITQFARVGRVGSAHVGAAGGGPVSPRGWRRVRWLKRGGGGGGMFFIWQVQARL